MSPICAEKYNSILHTKYKIYNFLSESDHQSFQRVGPSEKNISSCDASQTVNLFTPTESLLSHLISAIYSDMTHLSLCCHLPPIHSVSAMNMSHRIVGRFQNEWPMLGENWGLSQIHWEVRRTCCTSGFEGVCSTQFVHQRAPTSHLYNNKWI